MRLQVAEMGEAAAVRFAAASPGLLLIMCTRARSQTSLIFTEFSLLRPHTAAPASSRFNMDVLEEKKPAVQRGKVRGAARWLVLFIAVSSHRGCLPRAPGSDSSLVSSCRMATLRSTPAAATSSPIPWGPAQRAGKHLLFHSWLIAVSLHKADCREEGCFRGVTAEQIASDQSCDCMRLPPADMVLSLLYAATRWTRARATTQPACRQPAGAARVAAAAASSRPRRALALRSSASATPRAFPGALGLQSAQGSSR